MPTYGPKAGSINDKRKAPTTKAQYRESIISYMKHSGELAQKADQPPRNNPERLPEMSMWNGKHMSKRQWTVAQDMVAEGVVVITNGSFETGSVYLVAGPNWVD